MSVCNAVVFASLDLESSFFVHRCTFSIFRTSSYIKIIGSKSESQKQKVCLCILFTGGLPSTESHSCLTAIDCNCLERSATIALSSGVPQGSILWPLLFVMYVSPIDDIVCVHRMQYHKCADDLMLYTALAPSMFSDLSSIANCTDAVSKWFMENALLLNPVKTETVIFGTRQCSAGLDITGGINVARSTVQFNSVQICVLCDLSCSISSLVVVAVISVFAVSK